jgi:hypothetical protein
MQPSEDQIWAPAWGFLGLLGSRGYRDGNGDASTGLLIVVAEFLARFIWERSVVHSVSRDRVLVSALQVKVCTSPPCIVANLKR